VTEIKNIFEDLTRKLYIAKEMVNELEHISMATFKSEIQREKKNEEEGRETGRVVQMVEHLPSKFKALSSNPSTRERERERGRGREANIQELCDNYKRCSKNANMNSRKAEKQENNRRNI
jgi:hypothetical protein